VRATGARLRAGRMGSPRRRLLGSGNLRSQSRQTCCRSRTPCMPQRARPGSAGGADASTFCATQPKVHEPPRRYTRHLHNLCKRSIRSGALCAQLRHARNGFLIFPRSVLDRAAINQIGGNNGRGPSKTGQDSGRIPPGPPLQHPHASIDSLSISEPPSSHESVDSLLFSQLPFFIPQSVGSLGDGSHLVDTHGHGARRALHDAGGERLVEARLTSGGRGQFITPLSPG